MTLVRFFNLHLQHPVEPETALVVAQVAPGLLGDFKLPAQAAEFAIQELQVELGVAADYD